MPGGVSLLVQSDQLNSVGQFERDQLAAMKFDCVHECEFHQSHLYYPRRETGRSGDLIQADGSGAENAPENDMCLFCTTAEERQRFAAARRPTEAA